MPAGRVGNKPNLRPDTVPIVWVGTMSSGCEVRFSMGRTKRGGREHHLIGRVDTVPT
jgi:hypothetical protein